MMTILKRSRLSHGSTSLIIRFTQMATNNLRDLRVLLGTDCLMITLRIIEAVIDIRSQTAPPKRKMKSGFYLLRIVVETVVGKVAFIMSSRSCL